ncbi:hypothetical protein Tco_1295872, partial [Tanacetum coccineum]
MPASDIPVPAYFSDDSIGSSISLVILSDTETENAPEVEATAVVSPADVPVHHDSEPAGPPHKRCRSPPPDAPIKRRRVDARRWNFVKDKIDNWRHQEGEP